MLLLSTECLIPALSSVFGMRLCTKGRMATVYSVILKINLIVPFHCFIV